MKTSLPPYRGFRVLVEISRTQSVRKAARELGRSESSVSHQIRNLERQLGETLLEKNGRGIQLTAIAHSYARMLGPAFLAIDEAASTLARGRSSASTVSVTLAPSLATLWLIPHLSEIEGLCPDLYLRLATTTRILDIENDGIDIAIRYSSTFSDGLPTGDPIPEYAFPVCAPRIARTPEEFWSAVRKGQIIGNQSHPEDWTSWMKHSGQNAVSISPSSYLADSTMTLEAAAQGQGICIGRLPLATQMLRDRRLKAPMGTWTESGSFYHVERRTKLTTSRAKEFAQLLRDLLTRDSRFD